MGKECVGEQNALITVIIPVYNCAAYLAEAIDSVLQQPYKAIQIVLVNDGSTDGSGDICDRYVKLHDRVYVIHQKNSGVSAARNAGIEFALARNAGDSPNGYVAFLDADDVWAIGFADNSLRDILLKGYDTVGFQSCICSEDMQRHGDIVEMTAGIFCGGNDANKYHPYHLGAMLYACHLLQKFDIRFITGLKYTEDRIFKIQSLYLSETISLHKKMMYLYRMRKTSAVHVRLSGIPYYIPIIEGYIQCDQIVNQYTLRSDELTVGRRAASWYVTDMVLEHYRNFGSKRELHSFLKEKPEWMALVRGETDLGAKTKDGRYDRFMARENRQILKSYIWGVGYKVARMIKYLPIVSSIVDKQRFPYSNDQFC